MLFYLKIKLKPFAMDIWLYTRGTHTKLRNWSFSDFCWAFMRPVVGIFIGNLSFFSTFPFHWIFSVSYLRVATKIYIRHVRLALLALRLALTSLYSCCLHLQPRSHVNENILSSVFALSVMSPFSALCKITNNNWYLLLFYLTCEIPCQCPSFTMLTYNGQIYSH